METKQHIQNAINYINGRNAQVQEAIKRNDERKALMANFTEAFYEAIAQPLKRRVILDTDIPDPYDGGTVQILIDRSDGDGSIYRDGWTVVDGSGGEIVCQYGLSEQGVFELVGKLVSNMKQQTCATLRMPEDEYQRRRKAHEDWYHITNCYSYPY